MRSKKLQASNSSNVSSESFAQFNLSDQTQKGLSDSKFEKPTDIQSESLKYSLLGRDILGAAKTGSGKTLAFVVPCLEVLWREKWCRSDGLGALIITPTRELAYQIFEVINQVGRYHEFSVGLVIGGKDLKFEEKRMNQCNIIICTPGRLLQHMSENPLFNADNLRILILDEADRTLDLGFSKTMDAILEYLPQDRQTLLFSATQTKSVKDLARLSLKNPAYVSVHENAAVCTPDSLTQSYIVQHIGDKIDMLWSFLKAHQKKKILVFFSTCKQVKYVYELFSHLRCGLSLFALYGTLHQMRRMAIYNSFKQKEKAVLLATDLASRGLDFPEVNWVVQFDCPEDVTAYIHRAGRTARYTSDGESLLVLLPSEESAMIENLRKRKIPINQIDIDPSKIVSIRRKAEAYCARDVSAKESAQRAFLAYVKNCYLMKDKSVFNVDHLDLPAFSKSLGLEVIPRIRFLERLKSNQRKLESSKTRSYDHLSTEIQQTRSEQTQENKTEKLNTENILNGDDEGDDDGEELFQVKNVHRYDLETDTDNSECLSNEQALEKKPKKIITKANNAKKLLKKGIQPNKKVTFDSDGNPIEPMVPNTQKSEKVKLLDELKISGIDLNIAKEIMEEEDQVDKKLYRELIKAKHREKRLKEKALRRASKKDANDEYNSADDSGDIEIDRFIAELPDPDKIYGNQSSEDKSEADSEDENGPDDIETKEESYSDSESEAETTCIEPVNQTFNESDSFDDSDSNTKHLAKTSTRNEKLSSKVSTKRSKVFSIKDKTPSGIKRFKESLLTDEALALTLLNSKR